MSLFLRSFLALQAVLLASGCGKGHRPPIAPEPTEPTHVVYEANWGVLAVPLSGGTPVTLGLTSLPCRFAGVSGGRILFFSYNPWENQDLWSVGLDGAGRAALATSSVSEQLLGVVGGRAIVQRGAQASPVPLDPAVLSIPVTGGPALDLGAVVGSQYGTYGSVVDGQVMLFSDYRLLTIQADGTGPHLLFDDGAVATDVADGRAALRLADETVATVRLDGSDLRSVPEQLAFDGAPAFGFEGKPGPYFAGGQVVFVAREVDTPTPGQVTAALFAWSWPDDSARRLAGWPGAQVAIRDLAGSQVILSVGDASSGAASVVSVDVADGTVHQLGATGTTSHFVGRGNGYAALLQAGPGSTWDLVSARLDGSSFTPLAVDVRPGLLMDSAWIGADPVSKPVAWVGDRILFRQTVSGASELRSIRPDGSGLVTISRGDGDEVAWAVSGTTVVYGRTSAGQMDLYAVGIDGTGHVTLAETSAEEVFGLVAGSTLVFSRQEGAGRDLFAVPLTGGTATRLTSSGDVTGAVATF